MANNPALYNAVISGATGGTQNRWLTSTDSNDYNAFRTIILALADQVDSLIATISGGPSLASIQLMQSICEGVMSSRLPIDDSFIPGIANEIVALWTSILAGMDTDVPSIFGEENVLFDDNFAGGIGQAAPLALTRGTVGQSGFSYNTNNGQGQIVQVAPAVSGYVGCLQAMNGGGVNPHQGQIFRGEGGGSAFINAGNIKSWQAKCNPGVVAGSGGDFSVGFGSQISIAPTFQNNSCRFTVVEGASANRWQFVTDDGVLETTDTGVIASTAFTARIYDLRAELNTARTEWSAYIDDVLVAQHSTHIPSPTQQVNIGAIWRGQAFAWTAYFGKFKAVAYAVP